MSLSLHRSRHRGAALLATTAVAVLALALPASAHVTVSSDNSVRGASDAVLSFRVPNEEDKATVTKLQITFPSADPIPSVDPVVKPGWTITTKEVTFAKPITTDDGTISSGTGVVTWTAPAGGGIPVGQADTFPVLVGPLPDAPQVAFLAVQTYSDGDVVSWIQPTIAGQTEPDHPAPILTLAPTTGGDVGASATSPLPTVTASYATKSSAHTATALGIVGIVVGALGLVAAAFAISRLRRG